MPLRTPLHRLLDPVLARGAATPVVLVSGFWRSGTTWVQQFLADSLCAKTVFEPLSPGDPAWRRELAGRGLTDPNVREAFIPGPAGPDDPLWRHLDRLASGRGLSPAVLRARRPFSEAARRSVVLKDVRVQMNLEAIHRRYAVPVVHVRRHPCAVVSSLLAATEEGWTLDFAGVRLEALLAPLRGLEGFAPAAEDLAELDGDAVSRIATLWALTERWVARSTSERPWISFVQYEEAIARPRETMAAMMASAGLEARRRASPFFESATTFRTVRGSDYLGRADAWRRRLAPGDIARIEAIVRRLHPRGLPADARAAA